MRNSLLVVFLWLLWPALGAGSLAVAPSPGRVDSPRPNVLLITIDSLRADHLGAYGSATVQTPNMDRLPREGVLFSRAMAHARTEPTT